MQIKQEDINEKKQSDLEQKIITDINFLNSEITKMQVGIYKIKNFWYQALDNDLKTEELSEKISSKSIKFNKAYHDLASLYDSFTSHVESKVITIHESFQVDMKVQKLILEVSSF